jgi:asparagine synthase (glutamine-hydrolysing)
MCGIAGFAGLKVGAAEGDAILTAMCAAIRHRGPDDEGHYSEPGVALGMRRLSIIDVAHGAQPISNEDDTVQVVFNGEIYNHHALRAMLGTKHVLRTRADTEVLVHLYEEDGDALMHRLRGMFAFAIWDTRRHRLLLARDRVGIKPLYYWPLPEGGVAFASELRSLLTLEDFPRQLDRGALEAYLTLGYVPDPKAIFVGVHKLPPGHYLTWDIASGVRVQEYWAPVRSELRVADEREAIEELQRLLHDAVGSHLESEVPLGAFLSGGIDSSSVVAEMARQLERPVRTFSIGFEEPEFDEAPLAAHVARAFRTDHTELTVRPNADELIDEVVRAFDEPFGDSSALPTLLVSHLARQHVTVALSGDGGDELFGGYTRYSELLKRRTIRSSLVRRALRELGMRLPHGALGRNRLLDLARTRQGRYAATVAQSLASAEGGVLAGTRAAHAPSLDVLFEARFAAVAGRDFLTQMTLVDMATYLPGDILTKVDRASMNVSLEARVPLLDHHLVEFALALPGSLKQRHGVGKWILRQAVKDLVPKEVLSHPKKGFAMPLRRWFRSDLRYRLDTLLRPDSPHFEFLERSSVERLVREHIAGRRDHSHMLWRLLVLQMWTDALARRQIERPSTSASVLNRHSTLVGPA